MLISASQIVRGAFLCTLSAHLVAEAIRRFVVYSNVLYLIADIAVLLSALVVLGLTKPRVPVEFIVLLALYVFWGAFCLAVSGEPLILLVFGVRPLLLALCAYVVARGFFGAGPSSGRTMAWGVLAWSIVVSLVGVLQITSGLGAEINRLPIEAGPEALGYGDYTVDNLGLIGIFRPTSIFMHTGRFGQFAFIASLVLVTSALLNHERLWRAVTFVAVALFMVLLSGQRAALLFLALSVVALLLALRNLRLFGKLLLVLVAIAPLALLATPDLLTVVWLRFSSVLASVDDRITQNLHGALEAFEQFGMFGKGLGFFSFGSGPYGGAVYYEYMFNADRYVGFGENAWLRIQGETGTLGLLSCAGLVYWLARTSLRRFFLERNPEMRAFHFMAGAIGISLAAWAFTADVFANYLILMQWFIILGGSTGYWHRRNLRAPSRVVRSTV